MSPAANKSDVTRRDLDVFFKPRSVAAIGATDREGHVGRSVLWNLISSPFGGTVYPVNSKKSSVLGIKAYPDVASLPEAPELAVIMTPAETVPGVIEECARAGVKGAVIISAGFREAGQRGLELERQILAAARPAKMRIIGPNCLGVMCPVTGLNATFAHTMARPGTVAFVSQSGAMCTAILDWSLREQIGFSAFISAGSMLDVGWGDLIDYLGDDPQHAQHRDLHGIHRRCAVVSFGGARSGVEQTHHRDQGRAHGAGRQSRGVAHRLDGRQRRCAGSGLPARGRVAREQHLPTSSI